MSTEYKPLIDWL